MNRLSALDALFLYAETPRTPTHVAGLMVFAPAPRDRDVFAAFREHTAERLDRLPLYRRKLAPTPFGSDHPMWVVADNVDLDYHVRHVALPKPGTMAQLRELVARLHASPLDRDRPLWQHYLIEGLEGDAFAVYAKMHHCTMDAVAGMSTLGIMYDLTAEGEPPQRYQVVRTPAEPADFLELTSTAVADFLRQGVRTVKSAPSAVSKLIKAAPSLTKDTRYLFNYVGGMPRTPFNVAISGHRSYGVCSLPLREVKDLGKARGATINDVVMAVCAGALRRYLAEHGALPKAALAAGMPASTRASGDALINNQVTFTLVRLPTNIAAPLPRLAAARTAGQEAKNLFADVRDLLTTDVSIIGAPLFLTGLARLLTAARVANFLPWWFNVVISNVPGPRKPVYCAGAPAQHYFPLSLPYHGCALNITVHSYLDHLDFGLVACRRTVPDVQSIADYMVEDFNALREAHEALNCPGAVEQIEVARSRALLTNAESGEPDSAKQRRGREAKGDAIEAGAETPRAHSDESRSAARSRATADASEPVDVLGAGQAPANAASSAPPRRRRASTSARKK